MFPLGGLKPLGRRGRRSAPPRPLFINISNNGIEIVPPPRENGPKKANEVLTASPAAEPLADKEKSDWPGVSQGADNRLPARGGNKTQAVEKPRTNQPARYPFPFPSATFKKRLSWRANGRNLSQRQSYL